MSGQDVFISLYFLFITYSSHHSNFIPLFTSKLVYDYRQQRYELLKKTTPNLKSVSPTEQSDCTYLSLHFLFSSGFSLNMSSIRWVRKALLRSRSALVRDAPF